MRIDTGVVVDSKERLRKFGKLTPRDHNKEVVLKSGESGYIVYSGKDTYFPFILITKTGAATAVNAKGQHIDAQETPSDVNYIKDTVRATAHMGLLGAHARLSNGQWHVITGIDTFNDLVYVGEQEFYVGENIDVPNINGLLIVAIAEGGTYE